MIVFGDIVVVNIKEKVIESEQERKKVNVISTFGKNYFVDNNLSCDTDGFESAAQRDFPVIVNVCVIRGKCPCNCVHCPVGVTPKNERKKVFGDDVMKLSLFKKIVDEVSLNKKSTIRIHGVGEPMDWLYLSEAIRYSKEKGVQTWIFTSAVTTNMLLLEQVVKNCDIIEFSVNSFTKDDYIKTKGIDAFELVKKNIEYASKFKKENKLNTRLLATRVETIDGEQDKKFIDFWKSCGLLDESFVRSYHNYNNILPTNGDKQKRAVIPCLVHWARFNVDANGEAVICFNELFKSPKNLPEIVLGNLNTQKIADIWHCKKLEEIRTAQLTGDYSKITFMKELPCVSCVFCQPLVKIRDTSEKQLEKIKC